MRNVFVIGAVLVAAGGVALAHSAIPDAPTPVSMAVWDTKLWWGLLAISISANLGLLVDLFPPRSKSGAILSVPPATKPIWGDSSEVQPIDVQPMPDNPQQVLSLEPPSEPGENTSLDRTKPGTVFVWLQQAVGLLTAVFSAALASYVRLNVLIPTLTAGAIAFVMWRTLPIARRPMILAASILAGHGVWMLAGGIYTGRVAYVLGDVIPLLAAAIALLAVPGWCVTTAIVSLSTLAALAHLEHLLSHAAGSVAHRALTMHLMLRALAAVCAVAGLWSMERSHGPSPPPAVNRSYAMRRRARRRRPSLAIAVNAALAIVVLTIAARRFGPEFGYQTAEVVLHSYLNDLTAPPRQVEEARALIEPAIRGWQNGVYSEPERRTLISTMGRLEASLTAPGVIEPLTDEDFELMSREVQMILWKRGLINEPVVQARIGAAGDPAKLIAVQKQEREMERHLERQREERRLGYPTAQPPVALSVVEQELSPGTGQISDEWQDESLPKELRTRGAITSTPIRSLDRNAEDVMIAADGRWLIVPGEHDTFITLPDLTVRRRVSFDSAVSNRVLSSVGLVVAVGLSDGTNGLAVVPLERGSPVKWWVADEIHKVAASPSSPWVFGIPWRGSQDVVAINVETGRVRRTREWQQRIGAESLIHLHPSPDGKHLFALSNNCVLHFWVDEGQLTYAGVIKETEPGVHWICTSPDSKQVAVTTKIPPGERLPDSGIWSNVSICAIPDLQQPHVVLNIALPVGLDSPAGRIYCLPPHRSEIESRMDSRLDLRGANGEVVARFDLGDPLGEIHQIAVCPPGNRFVVNTSHALYLITVDPERLRKERE
jgi:hypothetical protein